MMENVSAMKVGVGRCVVLNCALIAVLTMANA